MIWSLLTLSADSLTQFSPDAHGSVDLLAARAREQADPWALSTVSVDGVDVEVIELMTAERRLTVSLTTFTPAFAVSERVPNEQLLELTVATADRDGKL